MGEIDARLLPIILFALLRIGRVGASADFTAFAASSLQSSAFAGVATVNAIAEAATVLRMRNFIVRARLVFDHRGHAGAKRGRLGARRFGCA